MVQEVPADTRKPIRLGRGEAKRISRPLPPEERYYPVTGQRVVYSLLVHEKVTGTIRMFQVTFENSGEPSEAFTYTVSGRAIWRPISGTPKFSKDRNCMFVALAELEVNPGDWIQMEHFFMDRRWTDFTEGYTAEDDHEEYRRVHETDAIHLGSGNVEFATAVH